MSKATTSKANRKSRSTASKTIGALFTGAFALACVSVGQPAEATSPPAEAHCSGVPEDARRSSPLLSQPVAHQKTIVVRTTKQMTPRKVGSRLYVPAAPGMTKQWLERLAQCHIAQYANGAAASAHAARDPLAVSGVQAAVKFAEGGFFVELTANERDAVREIDRRARELRTPDSLRDTESLAGLSR